MLKHPENFVSLKLSDNKVYAVTDTTSDGEIYLGTIDPWWIATITQNKLYPVSWRIENPKDPNLIIYFKQNK